MPKLPQFQSQDRTLQMMQNVWGSILDPVIANAVVVGNLIKKAQDTDITLTTSGTIYNMTNIVVPAGVWLLWGFVRFQMPAATTETICMISETPLTQTGTEWDGSSVHYNNNPGSSIVQAFGPYPVKLLEPKKYFLNAQAYFAGASPTVKGTVYGVQTGVTKYVNA